MNVSGLFMDSAGVIHQYYETDVSQYYRLDICQRGTPYQTDPSGVEYSIFRKKLTMTYGDPTVYSEYMKLRDAIYNVHGEEVQESKWSDGKYYVIKTVTNKAKNFNTRTVICNGSPVEYEAHIGEQWLFWNAIEGAVAKMDPLNISQYKEKVIDADSSDHTTYTTPYYPLEVLIKRYDLQHLMDRDMVVADTLEVAEQRLQEWFEAKCDYKGFDTETTGLDVWKFGDDKLVGIILSVGAESSTFFPFRMKLINNLPKKLLDKLMKYCIMIQDQLVAHNKKFDRQVMMKEGYDLRIKWDTHIISFMLNPVTVKGAHALKNLMWEITQQKYLELSEIFISRKNIDFSVLPKDITRIYACPDSMDAVTVLRHLYPKVPSNMWPIIYIEMQLADLKADQEFYGIRVDVQKYKENYENCDYVIDMLVKTFRRMTHEDGNLGSPQVLATLLYDKMGCKVLMRTKTGKRSTSGKAIDKLASLKADKPHNITENMVDMFGRVVIKASTLANSKYPALVVLSKYREYVKRKTAFYARFERTMKTGRVGFWINQNGASSGRQSSPMHQLPPELKDVIISDSEYKDLWGPDYSQVELRMIAYLAGETDLIEMCKNPDNDIHRVCASLITGKEMWEITKAERSIKKRVNFGVVYLISGFGLAGQLYGPGYTKEQVEYCQEQLDAFYKRFKRINMYLKQNAIKVEKYGKMSTAFARVKYFSRIFDPDITRREKASLIRQANNMPVQGTAADLMKIAEVNMYNYIRKKGWNSTDVDGFPKVRVMLSIHDEVLISANRDIPMEEIIDMITTCMQIEIEGAPPFFVQPAKMETWGGHSDDSLAIPIVYRDKLIADYRATGKSAFRRSFYRVDMPSDKRAEMNNSKLTIREKVDEYSKYALYTKLYGDYSDALDEAKKKAAFTRYVESGFTTYTDDNYKERLDTYREKVLHDYMADLIEKYGPDPREVGMHVRHPSLTHELLDLYSKELKGQDLDHVEQINFAAERYMEDLGTTPVAEEVHEQKVVEMDKDKFYAQTENLYNFDKDGNIVYEEDVEDEDDFATDEDTNFILMQTSGKIYKAWKLLDTIVLDTSSLTVADSDKVIAEAWKYRKPDGFYRVMLSINGRIIDTKFRVEDLDIDAISDFISGLEAKPA